MSNENIKNISIAYIPKELCEEVKIDTSRDEVDLFGSNILGNFVEPTRQIEIKFKPNAKISFIAYNPKKHNLYNYSLPDKVYFNKYKNTTTLLRGNEHFTVKCDNRTIFSKRMGFLEAYFQMTSGMSKTSCQKYLDSLNDEKYEVVKKSKKEKLKEKKINKQDEYLRKRINQILDMNESQDKTFDMLECLIRTRRNIVENDYENVE